MPITLQELFERVVMEGALEPLPSGIFPNPLTLPEHKQALYQLNTVLTNTVTAHKLYFMMKSVTRTLTIGKQSYSLTDLNIPFFDFQELANNTYFINEGERKPLVYLDYDMMYEDGNTGKPQYFTIVNHELKFDVIPDALYPLNISYYSNHIGVSNTGTLLSALSVATDVMALPDRWVSYVVYETASRVYRTMGSDAKYASLKKMAEDELAICLASVKPAGVASTAQIIPHYKDPMHRRDRYYPFGTRWQ
jgi:hypothetical protein